MTRYADEDFDDAVDRLTDETIQREVDDKAEAAAKRNAAGISAEELALQDAHAEGARAGAQGSSFSLNPFLDGSAEHEAWNRGWQAAASVRAARMVA